MTATAWPFVELDEQGIAYVQGTTTKVIEIALDRTARHLVTAEEIQAAYPSLSLSQIHAALGYYFDHQDECNRQIEERQEWADALLERLENRSLQKRLRRLKSGA